MQTSTPAPNAAEPSKVLLIEDDADVAEMMARTLTLAGLSVKTVADGAVATYLVDHITYDAIVTDIRLPSVNGLQVVANARSGRANGKTPIVVVSGYLDESARQRSHSLGVAKVMAKPITPDELSEAVSAVVAARKLTTDPRQSVLDLHRKVFRAGQHAARTVMTHYLGGSFLEGSPHQKTQVANSHMVTSMVGFAGKGLRGSVAMGFERGFLSALQEKVYGGQPIPTGDGALVDLAAEMGNQVTGRLKANLVALGLPVNIGIPEVVTGLGHVVEHHALAPVLVLPLAVRRGSCHVEFCIVVDEGTAPEGDGADAGLAMGELTFFDDSAT